jgi:Asp-tRNA(Asn)/Glu-tRNA(Gln) amidotransferase A subunit family amidase
MEELQLDALVYPTDSLPPLKIGAPDPPAINGRPSNTVWSFLGTQGFPAITVPAGFTVQVYDFERDANAPLPPAETANNNGRREAVKIVGPVPARLPVGMDVVTRPFDEPTLLRIAAAFEQGTRHREPPAGFGPVAPAR